MSAPSTFEITLQIVDMTETAKTPDELDKILHAICYAVGGMISRHGGDSSTLMEMTEVMADAFMDESIRTGKSCDLEMVVGRNVG